MLALYAVPVTYDFEHDQWQATVAYADDDGWDDDVRSVDVVIHLGDDGVIVLGGDDDTNPYDNDDQGDDD